MFGCYFDTLENDMRVTNHTKVKTTLKTNRFKVWVKNNKEGGEILTFS